MMVAWPVAVLRIVFGVMYLDMALQKAPWVVSGGYPYGWLHGWLQQEIAHPTFGWYVAFLQRVVLPHFWLFGMLTFLTEMLLGLGLLLGILTRLAGLGGALWQVNIALGAYRVPGEWYWIWALLIVPQLVFAASGAGRALGLDAAIRARLARAPAGGWARLLRLAT
jgi:thiosulfate dehydrogenase [quinone] large subunit